MERKWTAAFIIAAAFIFAAGTPAAAKSGVNVGLLKCTVDGGIGLIFGSSTDMQCRFAPAGGGTEVAYRGKVNKVGIDIGVTEKSYIRWVVFAPGKLKPGALAGVYVGATA